MIIKEGPGDFLLALLLSAIVYICRNTMKYRSTCRFNLLLHLGNSVREIRPGEIIEYDGPVEDCPYLVPVVKEKVLSTKKKKKKDKLDG